MAAHPSEKISGSATALICCDELLTVMDELRLFPEGVDGNTSHQHALCVLLLDTAAPAGGLMFCILMIFFLSYQIGCFYDIKYAKQVNLY